MGVEDIEWCWLNGHILPLSEARVSVEDRGFVFADGVYEGIRIYNGRPFALARHLDRLENSCRGLMLSNPLNPAELQREMMRLIDHSQVRDGFLYLQLTRGPSRRNAIFPKETAPTLLFCTRTLPPVVPVMDQPGAKLITVPDDRWRRCWIKAIGLTANVQARNAADRAGADEAAFVDENGIVAECTSSNLFVVINGTLVTHPVGPRVLPGVTRAVVIDCAKSDGIEVIERPLRLDEAKQADEVFISSTTRHVIWVKTWDDEGMRGEKCGPITRKLSEAFQRRVDEETQA
ncbi:MAG: aminotransferase class IV [Anaerolineae bacterium]|nr:aminotransferase class IV [Phycisphaerae bacterium]